MDDEITLETIDLIRERAGASYGEAKDALNACGGDVVEALALLEADPTRKLSGRLTRGVARHGERALLHGRRLLHEGNRVKLRVSKGGVTVALVPATAAVVGALLAPKAVAIGAVAAWLGRCSFSVERNSGDLPEGDAL